jgi:23S rRNA-/tRNA-specific pseudouridylate synthase
VAAVGLPEPPAALENTLVEIEGMTILYSDDDIVAVDKPAGVAAHASVGWTGPTVLGGLAAAGYRITTSGVHERQGIVHRLDVGTSGVMVVAISERAYTVLKPAFKQRTIDKRYHALVQGHPDPSSGIAVRLSGRTPNWHARLRRNGRLTTWSHRADSQPQGIGRVFPRCLLVGDHVVHELDITYALGRDSAILTAILPAVLETRCAYPTRSDRPPHEREVAT